MNSSKDKSGSNGIPEGSKVELIERISDLQGIPLDVAEKFLEAKGSLASTGFCNRVKKNYETQN